MFKVFGMVFDGECASCAPYFVDAAGDILSTMKTVQVSAEHVNVWWVRALIVTAYSGLSACFLLPCARLISLWTGCGVISLRGRCACLLCTYNILVCTRYRSDLFPQSALCICSKENHENKTTVAKQSGLPFPFD